MSDEERKRLDREEYNRRKEFWAQMLKDKLNTGGNMEKNNEFEDGFIEPIVVKALEFTPEEKEKIEEDIKQWQIKANVLSNWKPLPILNPGFTGVLQLQGRDLHYEEGMLITVTNTFLRSI